MSPVRFTLRLKFLSIAIHALYASSRMKALLSPYNNNDGSNAKQRYNKSMEYKNVKYIPQLAMIKRNIKSYRTLQYRHEEDIKIPLLNMFAHTRT